jgi:hypothetical protein
VAPGDALAGYGERGRIARTTERKRGPNCEDLGRLESAIEP